MATEQIPENYGQFTVIYTQIGSPREYAWTCGYANLAESNPQAAAEKIIQSGEIGTDNVFDAINMHNTLTVQRVYVLQNRGGILESESVEIGRAGSMTGDAAPLNVTVVVNKRTSRAGRQFRGRMLLPGAFLTNDQLSNLGTIDNTRGDELRGAFNLFHENLTSNFIPPVLLHSQPKDPLAPIPGPTPIAQFEVRQQCGTDRRRMKRTSASF